MVPVKQTDFSLTTGNCFAACLASILELPLAQVPNCIEAPDWWDQYREWGRELTGCELSCFEANGWEPPPDVWAIVGGLTPRGHKHCVVWFDGKMAWNPLGTEEPLIEKMQWFLFVSDEEAQHPND